MIWLWLRLDLGWIWFGFGLLWFGFGLLFVGFHFDSRSGLVRFVGTSDFLIPGFAGFPTLLDFVGFDFDSGFCLILI